MQNAAVTLLDGKVLVIGGPGWSSTSGTPETTADLFDPTSGTFAPTAHPLTTARAGIRAVLASDGRVVVASAGDRHGRSLRPGHRYVHAGTDAGAARLGLHRPPPGRAGACSEAATAG